MITVVGLDISKGKSQVQLSWIKISLTKKL
ncbi:hypothetical protein J2Y73_004535 [Peribacillus frigoritolerans]|jgi:hypothetical protein|nr:hypothetical protein [Peribacillus frigoritolerans]